MTDAENATGVVRFVVLSGPDRPIATRPGGVGEWMYAAPPLALQFPHGNGSPDVTMLCLVREGHVAEDRAALCVPASAACLSLSRFLRLVAEVGGGRKPH